MCIVVPALILPWHQREAHISLLTILQQPARPPLFPHYAERRQAVEDRHHQPSGPPSSASETRLYSTFIMLHLYHEMDVDYFVVKEMINISKLFDYTCMFSIGAVIPSFYAKDQVLIVCMT
jgi:hypothetical protein